MPFDALKKGSKHIFIWRILQINSYYFYYISVSTMCIYPDYCVYHYKSTELVSLYTLDKIYYYYYILLTATCCIQLTTLSLLKYHWRREVLNQFGHMWIVKMILKKTMSRLAIKLSRFVFGQNYRFLNKSIPSCHTSDTSHITLFHNGLYLTELHLSQLWYYDLRFMFFYRDACDPHVLTATDMVTLIEYLCTI